MLGLKTKYSWGMSPTLKETLVCFATATKSIQEISLQWDYFFQELSNWVVLLQEPGTRFKSEFSRAAYNID